MYADREEALRHTLETDMRHPPSMSAADRERQLQEELRRRAADSRRPDTYHDTVSYRGGEESMSPDARRASRRRGVDPYNDERGRAYYDQPDHSDNRWNDYARSDHHRHGPHYEDAARHHRGGGRRHRHHHVETRRRSRSPPPSRRGPALQGAAYEARSILCSELEARVGQRDLGEFLEEYLGRDTVLDVRLCVSYPSGASLGIGFVELAHPDLVSRALELNGKPMFGAPIHIQRTDAAMGNSIVQSYEPKAESSRSATSYGPSMSAPTGPILPPSAMEAQGIPAPSNPEARLYVGNLHFDISAAHVRAVFEPFGRIDDVEVYYNPATGKSKGFAFVQFREKAEAQQAMEQLNGFELAGRAMRVGPVNARGTGPEREGRSEGPSSELPMSSSDKRFALMEKLARTDTESQEPSRPVSIPEATSCAVLLKHMFNPAEYVLCVTSNLPRETEPNWAQDLREDIREECSRHGHVQFVYVDQDSAEGEVYVCFGHAAEAQQARTSLHGRFFGGNRVEASLYVSVN